MSWDRYSPGRYPWYESKSEVRTEVIEKVTDATEVMPKIKHTPDSLETRVAALETQRVSFEAQVARERAQSVASANWALFAMMVSVLAAALSVAVLISVAFLGG